MTALGLVGLVGACEATVPGLGVDNSDPAAELIGQFNRDVLPLIQVRCDTCHAGSRAGLNFSGVAGSNGDDDPFTTVYDRVKAWPALINVEAPAMSRIITKGLHEGPAWTSDERDLIIPWLQNEAAFNNSGGGGGGGTETNAVLLLPGINTLDLGTIGIADMIGTLVTFEYERVGSLLYFSSIKFKAPATGAFIENPVFTIVIADTFYPDPINTFDGVKLDLGPNDELFLGGGTLIRSDLGNILNGATEIRLRLEFKNTEPVGTGVDNSDPFACKTPDSPEFAAFQAAINGQNCGAAGCHSVNDEAGGGGGFSVFGWLSPDGADKAAFCKNIRGKTNLTDPQNAAHILIDKNDGTTGHQGNANGAVGNWGPLLIQWATLESQAP